MTTLFRGYINIYRSGWFHRAGKPQCFDRHSGDVYPTYDAAVRAVSPRSHYVCTVPVVWHDAPNLRPNPAHSVPVPLNVTRRAEALRGHE